MPLPSERFNTPPVNEARQGPPEKGRRRRNTLSTGEVITREVPERKPKVSPADPTWSEPDQVIAVENNAAQPQETSCNSDLRIVDSAVAIPPPMKGFRMDITAPQTFYVTDQTPADLTNFRVLTRAAQGKTMQGVKYTSGDAPVVFGKRYFTGTKPKPTKEEARLAREAAKAAKAALTPAELLAKMDQDEINRAAAIAKKRAKLLAALNQPQPVGA